MTFKECHYKSADGLDLYYRTYGEETDRAPLVCLSGLTRNSGDFDDFAHRYCRDRRVYALDYRGRGKSAYDPDYRNYNPQTYIADVLQFLTVLGIDRAVLVGTSLGGIISMALAAMVPDRICGVVLNDIGPEINAAGGSRIAGYVGKDIRFDTLEQAAEAQKTQFLSAYPDLVDAGWMKTTLPAFILDAAAGNYRPNYDLAIGKALLEQVQEDNPVDLWPFFKALKSIPTLAIRGALSDVLSEEVFDKMKAAHPNMEHVTIKNRGHVPQLDEPEALEKLDEFLERV
ncbi:alpha/beta fold hydrolase [Sneathiella chinensis]|nr:alpha/beta hydrolase [Sneathiella chinensis]